MDKTKNTRKNYGTAYFATAFLAAFFFEFYWIMTDPYNHFMLLGTGFIMIIMGYLTIDSLLKAKADNDAIRNEQNEMMLKAQKAIYIATKKNSKDSAIRQAQSVKAMELMMNKMISSQQALLEEKNGDDMNALIDQLSASNAKLAKEVQSALTVNQLVKANADLVKNVKEALNASAMSLEETMDLGAYVNEAVGNPAPQPAAPVVAKPTAPTISEIVEESSVEEEISLVAEEPIFEAEENVASEINIPVMNEEETFTPDIDIPVMDEEETFTPDIDIPSVDEEDAFATDIDLSIVNEENEQDIEVSDFEIPAMNLEEEIETATADIELPTEDFANEESMDEMEISDELVADDITIDDIAADEIPIADVPMDDELVSDVSDNFELDTMDVIENEINMAEMERSEALEAITIPDEMTPELDEAMTEGNPEDIMDTIEMAEDIVESDDIDNINDISTYEDDSISEDSVNDVIDTVENVDDENETEDIVEEEIQEDVDDDDDIEPLDLSSGEIPNRQLSDEEIAALFASL